MNDNITDAETMFRDLFGKEELEQARQSYFEHGMNNVMKYSLFLDIEKQRKLREQDND